MGTPVKISGLPAGTTPTGTGTEVVPAVQSSVTSKLTLAQIATWLAQLAQTLTNKSLDDSTTAIQNTADTTKKVKWSLSGVTAAVTGTLAFAFTTAKTITFPDATDTLVGKATTDVLTNKTYDTGGTGNVFKVGGAVAGTAGNIVLDSGTAWTSAPMTSSGFRNRVINGDMRIDQANAGASVTVNSAVVTYGPDMWNGWGTGAAGVFTMQQLSTTPPAGFKNYLRVQTTTADAAPAVGSVYYITTKIEGLNLIDFQFGTAGAVQFTTSAQLRSTLTGTFSGTFLNGAANRSYPWTCTINAANTWTPIVVTLTGDTTGTWATDNTIGLYCILDIGSGSSGRSTAATWQAGTFFGVTGAVRLISTLNATLDITGVQIEKGAVATPFEVRDYEAELLRCQRYLPAVRCGGSGAAEYLGMSMVLSGAASVLALMPFKVPARVPVTGVTVSSAGNIFTINNANAPIASNTVVFTAGGKDQGVLTIAPSVGTYTAGFASPWGFTSGATTSDYILFTGARL